MLRIEDKFNQWGNNEYLWISNHLFDSSTMFDFSSDFLRLGSNSFRNIFKELILFWFILCPFLSFFKFQWSPVFYFYSGSYIIFSVFSSSYCLSSVIDKKYRTADLFFSIKKLSFWGKIICMLLLDSLITIIFFMFLYFTTFIISDDVSLWINRPLLSNYLVFMIINIRWGQSASEII